MKRFQLKYHNETMEKEYTSLQQTSNHENIQLSFYFLIFLLSVPGIPALIQGNYLDLAITIIMGSVLFVIYFWKAIPRKYVQFLSAIIICSFDNCIFLLPTTSLEVLPKGIIYLRGYAFASISVALLTRFTSLKQKILFLIYALAFRLVLMIYLDNSSAEAYAIFRSFYIDLYVAYSNFSYERKNRTVFKNFFEYREELTKFKELLSDYFPQSITVFSNLKEKPLFSNKAFINIFDQSQSQIDSPDDSQGLQIKDDMGSPLNKNLKLSLKYLQVDRNSIRELGDTPHGLGSPSKPMYFQDVLSHLEEMKLLDQKPLSLSTSYSFNHENKSFEVILTKIKWDGEDATVVILNDITYQEKLINLKISDKNKDQIIATVSHELRTPLNGIIGILGMAEKRINDKKVIEYIDLCKDNAHLLLGLVNSLLDLHQVRQGKLRLNPTKVRVKQVLLDVIRLFMFQCKNKGIFLTLDLADDVPTYIDTDDNRLKQILINLIGNALKFTLDGGITVEVRQDSVEKDSLEICVSDTGIGIKEEEKEKLFQMYEKLEHGRNVNKNGVGLGLTISNTLASLLGKSSKSKAIEIKSSVNQGSKFSFKILKNLNGHSSQSGGDMIEQVHFSENIDSDSMTTFEELKFPKELPKKASNASGYPLKMNQYIFSKNDSTQILTVPKKMSRDLLSPHASFGSTKNFFSENSVPRNDNTDLQTGQNRKSCVLVVDDNIFNLLVAENIIKELGYSFEAAKSGHEAIQILKSKGNEPDVFKAILMDCQMPIMDGFETTKIIKVMMEKGEIHCIPIIALTANNGEEDIKQCYESGMADHLSKPLFANKLIKIFAKLTSI